MKKSLAPGEAIFGRGSVAVARRKELAEKHAKAGAVGAEAARLATIQLSQELVIEIIRVKKVPLDRLATALHDTVALEIMEA